jgi:hypothetical protein
MVEIPAELTCMLCQAMAPDGLQFGKGLHIQGSTYRHLMLKVHVNMQTLKRWHCHSSQNEVFAGQLYADINRHKKTCRHSPEKMPLPVEAVTRGRKLTNCSTILASMLLWSASHSRVAAACDLSAWLAGCPVTEARLDPAPSPVRGVAAAAAAAACARQASRLRGHCSTTSMRASSSRTTAAQHIQHMTHPNRTVQCRSVGCLKCCKVCHIRTADLASAWPLLHHQHEGIQLAHDSCTAHPAHGTPKQHL